MAPLTMLGSVTAPSGFGMVFELTPNPVADHHDRYQATLPILPPQARQ